MYRSSEPLPLAGVRVLLADDVAAIRNVYSRALVGAGAAVVTAGDGDDALTLFREAAEAGTPFDAAVLDYAMPEQDGLEVTTALRRRGFAGAIVGVSAEVGMPETYKWLLAGCDEVLVKGVSLAELVAAVAKALERRNTA
jgi:CheY-like chemotaxis protein